MLRYVLTSLISAVAGAGIMIVLFLVANPIPSSLVCSVDAEGTVIDCTDESGEQVDIPHTVRIR